MRATSLKKTLGFAFTLVSAAFALTAAQPVAAQSGQADVRGNSGFSLRAGVHFPFNRRISNNIGSSFFAGGIDYAFYRESLVRKSFLSLDYFGRSANGLDVQVIPLTVGEMHYLSTGGGTRFYTQYGGGLYFIDQTVPDATGTPVSKSGPTMGGYVGGGMEISQSFFIDARIHVTGAIGGTSPGGLQLMLGTRL